MRLIRAGFTWLALESLLCAPGAQERVPAAYTNHEGRSPLFETTLVFRVAPEDKPNYRIPSILQAPNGDVMAVSRNESAADSPDNLRHLIAISPNGGETWGAVRRAEELITPRCEVATERFTLASKQEKNRLLLSSPASPFRQKEHPYGRYNLTIRLSYDEGATWTAGKTTWAHPASYSDIVALDDMTIGVVYERGDKGSTHYWDELHFARFNLEWLTDGRDSLGPMKESDQ